MQRTPSKKPRVQNSLWILTTLNPYGLPPWSPLIWTSGAPYQKLLTKSSQELLRRTLTTTVDVIYVASNRNNTAPGASGEVQDHQEHHQDDQEKLQDHFYVGFIWF